MNDITIALVGQPNVGKTTLFNTLTHGHYVVTNWPGTTVEKHIGKISIDGYRVVVVDLPGIYGLTYSTIEEKISRDFILEGEKDIIVVLVDSLALERTLYLAIEILELTNRVVVAVTKTDEAHSRGIHINYTQLEKSLGVPVVPISAAKNIGLRKLLETAIAKSRDRDIRYLEIDYGELDIYIDAIETILKESSMKPKHPPRWIAIKFLERDPEIEKELLENSELYDKLTEIRLEAERRFGENIPVIVSSKRFEFIDSITKNSVVKIKTMDRKRDTLTIFYNPYLSPFLSITILLSIFTVVFTVNTGYPLVFILRSLGLNTAAEILDRFTLSNLIEGFSELSSEFLYSLLGVNTLSRFLIEGVISGLLILLLFTPLIFIVFVILGALEDSGIAPRIAVGLHPLLQKIGLSGHAVFPITLSLGCNVPGVLATRAIPNVFEKIRLLMTLPLIPCQARLVVLLAVASVIGGFTGSVLIPLAYLTSLALLITINYIFYFYSRIRGSSESIELLLELPPVHRPLLKVTWWYTWFHIRHFLVKAGTVIVLGNMLIWLLMNISPSLRVVDDRGGSIAATISRYMAPIVYPIGVSGEYAWMIVFALITGFIAKELFLSTLLAISGYESIEWVSTALGLSKPSIIAISILVSLYMPCLATLTSIYLESRSLKLTLKTLIISLLLAYITSIVIYHLFNAIPS